MQDAHAAKIKRELLVNDLSHRSIMCYSSFLLNDSSGEGATTVSSPNDGERMAGLMDQAP